MIKKIKADVIAVGCVLLAAAMFFCILYFMDSSDAEAVIMQGGNVGHSVQYLLRGDRFSPAAPVLMAAPIEWVA